MDANTQGFPVINLDNGTIIGLTKREYFAAIAMQAIYTNAGRNGFNFSAHIAIAKESFLISDAMIKESNNGR